MNILVLGGGGREHAITWALAKSPRTDSLFVAPGNGGTSDIAQNVTGLNAEDGQAVLAFVREHGIDLVVIGPEAPLVAGVADVLRAASPESSLASWAYRFCMNQPNVLTVLSGVSNIEQVRENVADFQANRPFSAAEQEALNAAIETLRGMASVPCTNCRYCVKECPQGVVIPEILSLLNLELMTENRPFVKGLYSWQAAPGPASKCIACGACESMCPQGIDIVRELEVAAEHFE